MACMVKIPTERRKTARPYIDTNVILDYIRGRNEDSRRLMQAVKDQALKFYTSFFTYLELIDTEQESKWILRRWQEGETLDDILRHRYPRELNADELVAALNLLKEKFFKPFVDTDIALLMLPDADTWDEVPKLMRKSNFSIGDAFHVDAAVSNESDIFITRDSYLVKMIEDAGLLPASRPVPHELDKKLAAHGFRTIVPLPKKKKGRR